MESTRSPLLHRVSVDPQTSRDHKSNLGVHLHTRAYIVYSYRRLTRRLTCLCHRRITARQRPVTYRHANITTCDVNTRAPAAHRHRRFVHDTVLILSGPVMLFSQSSTCVLHFTHSQEMDTLPIHYQDLGCTQALRGPGRQRGT